VSRITLRFSAALAGVCALRVLLLCPLGFVRCKLSCSFWLHVHCWKLLDFTDGLTERATDWCHDPLTTHRPNSHWQGRRWTDCSRSCSLPNSYSTARWCWCICTCNTNGFNRIQYC